MEGTKQQPTVVRRYYNENNQVILDCYDTFDKEITLYGHNQLHEEIVTLLPCGNPPMLMAGENPNHTKMFHKKVCDGKEHVTTCGDCTDSYFKKWGTKCNIKCKVFLACIKQYVEACFMVITAKIILVSLKR